MRLVILSDTHGQHEQVELPEGDVLIHCGDFTAFGQGDEVNSFLKWMGAQPHPTKIAVPGNHDCFVEKKLTWAQSWASAYGVHLLVDELVSNRGVVFWGSPYTPKFGRWWFSKERGSDIQAVWDQIHPRTNVLITHGPPFGVGDLVPLSPPRHAGCIDLLNTVQAVQPDVHCFGHIHAGYGVYRADDQDTVYINAAMCSEGRPRLTGNAPIVWDLDVVQG